MHKYVYNICKAILNMMIYKLNISQIAEGSGSPTCDRAELLLQQGHQQQLCIPNASSSSNVHQNNAGGSGSNNGQNHIDRTTNILMMSSNDQSTLRNRKRNSPDVNRFVYLKSFESALLKRYHNQKFVCIENNTKYISLLFVFDEN